MRLENQSIIKRDIQPGVTWSRVPELICTFEVLVHKIPLKTDGSTVKRRRAPLYKNLDSVESPVDHKDKVCPHVRCKFTLYTTIDARKGALRAYSAHKYELPYFPFIRQACTRCMPQQQTRLQFNLDKLRQRVQRIMKVKGGRTRSSPFTLSKGSKVASCV